MPLSLKAKLYRSALQAALSCKAKGAAEVESHTTDLTNASAIDQLVSTLLQRHKVRRKLFTGSCSCDIHAESSTFLQHYKVRKVFAQGAQGLSTRPTPDHCFLFTTSVTGTDVAK